ncbi:hypothetical protein V1292_003581 [Bradyrhizobium sp. AZCC 1719]
MVGVQSFTLQPKKLSSSRVEDWSISKVAIARRLADLESPSNFVDARLKRNRQLVCEITLPTGTHHRCRYFLTNTA